MGGQPIQNAYAVRDKNNIITYLNSQILTLTSQKNQFQDIVNLAKSTIWIKSQTVSQTANSYIYWTLSADYAGYVSVTIESSTSSKVYVRIIYSSHGVNYDNQITVGRSGTAVFPILPASIEIRVGNKNFLDGATETVTITYYY